MKIKAVFFAFLLLLATGCRLTSYTAQPGSPRTAFPAEMHGTYIAVEKHNGVSDTTKLVIAADKIEINDAFFGKYLKLTDSTTLTHLGDYYFFNVRNTDSAGKYNWSVFPIRVKENALYIFNLPQGKQQKIIEKYLKKSPGKSGEYIMDNEPFKNFCEKHLKKRKALKLKRIK